MGFGAGGYWSQNGKTYGQKNPADAHAYAKGTGGVSDYDTGLQHAYGVGKPNPADAHKYAQGTGGVSDYDTGMKHAYDVNKKAERPSGALGAKERQIAQKQDEIVNGQNLSDSKKYKLNDELRDLQAEKNVITWQQQNPSATEEDYDSKKDYYNEQINRAADDYLNNWGGKDTAESKEAWAEYSEKVHGIVAQRDAYNRAAMGVDTSVPVGENGSSTVPVEVEAVSKTEEEKPITPTQGLIDDMFNAGGEGVPEVEAKSDEALGSYLDDMFNDGGKWQQEAIGIDREDEVEKIQVLLAAQKQSEINFAFNLKNTVYTEAFAYFDAHPELQIVFQNQTYGYSSTEELTDDQLYQLKLDYAEDEWQRDPASKVDISDILEDIDTKFEDLEEEAIADLENVIENQLRLDENAAKRDGLDINTKIRVSDIIENPPSQESSMNIVEETLINLGRDGELYLDLIENGNCEIMITGYEEKHLTEQEATDLYYDEQEQRNEMFALLVSVIESAVTANPAPLIANVGELLVSELAGDELEAYLSESVVSLIATGGNLAEFAKGQAQDVLIESLLNTIDASRHDITKIEAGNYVDARILFNDSRFMDGSGERSDAHIRFIEKDGEYVWDYLNPLNYVINLAPDA